ncbi:MAG: AAA family ATPase [Bacteroidetes bacterium]|nr:AAA family ATPase [Bacteroidota bacterium]
MDTQQMIVNTTSIYNRSFIDSRAYFQYCYHKVPCITWVDQVNAAKALDYIKTEYADTVTEIVEYSKYNRRKGKTQYSTTLVLMRDNCLLEIGETYVEVLHTSDDYLTAHALVKELSRFKRRERKQDFEINLVIKDDYGLSLKGMEIKKTKLDLSLYYEDEFVVLDKLIQQRLNRKKDKGIVLLHGLAGTGKTTYLRYLVGRLRKRVLFLSPAVAENIMDSEFMELLIDNPDSILIIEDAEDIIKDRRTSPGSSVSNLLNISDGLLSDFLNVQLICTFNNPLSLVDSALLRKGRLIAKYDFAKLSVGKAQRLSDHLGFKNIITKPMTIAEIAHQNEKEYSQDRIEIKGFRRDLIEN